MDQKKSFGEYIRRKRQEAGLTQRQLAERLFVAESTVSKWERGLSYPDVALIPAVCRELGISEHEFFAAQDDEQEEALCCAVEAEEVSQARPARTGGRLARGWQIFFACAYGIAAGVCFICDLAVFHRLDWFWIVLTSLLLAFSFTNLPFLVRENRAVVCLASATGALLLLLLACWRFVGGIWILGGLAITAVSLALPWGVWVVRRFWKGRTAVGIMVLLTVWVPVLLAVIRFFAGGEWLLSLGWPIAWFCLMFLWTYFTVAYWLPVSRWCKAGLLTAITAFAVPLGDGFATWLSTGERAPTLFQYFAWWRIFAHESGGPSWVNILVFTILLTISAALLAVAVMQKARGRSGEA